jgi:hypothetical protein
MLPHYTWNPLEDGVTHCNCYSKGRTPLGRALSNFAKFPFIHPVHGHFASIEAFWYYIGTGCQHQELRSLFGYAAKDAGSRLEQVPMERFDEQIEEAIMMKVEQHPILLSTVINCIIPFTHYYVYGSGPYRVVDKTGESGYLLNALARIKEKYPKKELR